jgi:hypothetical protein
MMAQLADGDRLGPPTLSIGLGAVQSCANYAASRTGKRWTARGTSTTTTSRTRFACGTTPPSLPPRAMIPLSDARAAMAQFLFTNVRPFCLPWSLS